MRVAHPRVPSPEWHPASRCSVPQLAHRTAFAQAAAQLQAPAKLARIFFVVVGGMGSNQRMGALHVLDTVQLDRTDLVCCQT
jgi:hypothetical protein